MMQKQPVQIKGYFVEDSAKIGQSFHYSLTVTHPKSQEIFFPGINQRFGQLYPVKKDYFTTRTQGKSSIDSAVYTFKSFNIDDFQTLQIPVYTWADGDCTQLVDKPDTIFLKRLQPNAKTIDLDSLYQTIPIAPLKPKPELKNVLLGGVGLLVLIGLVYWIFGNRIKRGIKIYLLWRKNIDFKRGFQRLQRNIANTSKGLQNLESAFSLWKNYLENLTRLPFSTFSTTEMVDNLSDKRLINVLKEVDSAIYGGNFSEKTIDAVKLLIEIAQTLYLQEREKISLEKKSGW
jgi:hypothetical protein